MSEEKWAERPLNRKEITRFLEAFGCHHSVKRVNIAKGGTKNYFLYEAEVFLSGEFFQKLVKGSYDASFQRYEHTKIVPIDVDRRNLADHFNYTDVIRFLDKKFNLKPVFIETTNQRDYKKRSAHIYYSFNTFVENGLREFLESECHKAGMLCEVIRKGGYLNNPLSVKYRKRFGGYDPLQETLMERVQPSSSMRENIEIATKLVSVEPQKLITPLQKKNKSGIVVPRLDDKEREIPSNKFVYYIEPPTTDYTYGNGTRHSTQIAIGFKVLRENGDFEEYIKQCEYYNDGTSKDMGCRYDKRIKMLEGQFNWCKDNFGSRQGFLDRKLYDSMEKELLGDRYYKSDDRPMSNAYYHLYETIIRRASKTKLIPGKFHKPSAKLKMFHRNQYKGFDTEDQAIDCAITYLNEFLKIKKYHEKRTYKFPKSSIYENLNDLNNGIPLSQALRYKIANYFGYTQQQANFVWDKILKPIFFEPIKIKKINSNNYYTSSYKGEIRFCEHFNFRNPVEILMSFNKDIRKNPFSYIDKCILRMTNPEARKVFIQIKDFAISLSELDHTISPDSIHDNSEELVKEVISFLDSKEVIQLFKDWNLIVKFNSHFNQVEYMRKKLKKNISQVNSLTINNVFKEKYLKIPCKQDNWSFGIEIPDKILNFGSCLIEIIEGCS